MTLLKFKAVAIPVWLILALSILGASTLMIAATSAPGYAEKDDSCTGDKRRC